MRKETRTERIVIRVSPREVATAKKAAAAEERKLSDWIRVLILRAVQAR